MGKSKFPSPLPSISDFFTGTKATSSELFSAYRSPPYAWTKDDEGAIDFFVSSSVPPRTMHSERCSNPAPGEVSVGFDVGYFRNTMRFTEVTERLQLTKKLVRWLAEEVDEIPIYDPIPTEYHFSCFVKDVFFDMINCILAKALFKDNKYTRMVYQSGAKNKSDRPDWLLVMDVVAVVVVVLRSPLTLENQAMTKVMEMCRDGECTVRVTDSSVGLTHDEELVDTNDWRVRQAIRSLTEVCAAMFTHNVTTACLFNYDMSLFFHLQPTSPSAAGPSLRLHCSLPVYRDTSPGAHQFWAHTTSPMNEGGTLKEEYAGVGTTFEAFVGLACSLAQTVPVRLKKPKEKTEKFKRGRGRGRRKKGEGEGEGDPDEPADKEIGDGPGTNMGENGDGEDATMNDQADGTEDTDFGPPLPTLQYGSQDTGEASRADDTLRSMDFRQ